MVTVAIQTFSELLTYLPINLIFYIFSQISILLANCMAPNEDIFIIHSTDFVTITFHPSATHFLCSLPTSAVLKEISTCNRQQCQEERVAEADKKRKVSSDLGWARHPSPIMAASDSPVLNPSFLS
jgi:hypothetical protein